MGAVLSGKGGKAAQPFNRHDHFAVAIKGQLLVFGGSPVYGDGSAIFHQPSETEPASVVHCFSMDEEKWFKLTTTGDHPPAGLNRGAATVVGNSVFVFGGLDRYGRFSSSQNTLYELETTSMTWKLVSSTDGMSSAPEGKYMKKQPKWGCKMVYYDGTLVVYGGFVDAYTNEIHQYNLEEGKWFVPNVTGTNPYPNSSCYVSLTMVDDHRAVLYGKGAGPWSSRHLYILDLNRMHWSKVDGNPGDLWPEMRGGHAAVCLGYGGDHPQLLITGGSWGYQDAWTLDIETMRWREVMSVPNPGLLRRCRHSATTFSLGKAVEVVLFGILNDGSNNTTVLRFEYQEPLSSDEPPGGGEWVCIDSADISQLGSKDRVMKKRILQGVQSLQNLCLFVIRSALIHQRQQSSPEQLVQILPDYVPTKFKHIIIDHVKPFLMH